MKFPYFLACTNLMSSPSSSIVGKCVLAIHGGIASPRAMMTEDREREIHTALRDSLVAGHRMLSSDVDGSLAAVLAAVEVMEDSPVFNAGKGSVFTSAGTIEMDAAIMEGRTRNAGAVAHVKRIRNPIQAAHAVMTRSSAVFVVGAEADEFAESCGLTTVDPSYFVTERRLNDYNAWRERQKHSATQDIAEHYSNFSRGTVGAVALDCAGNLAAATSTGGVSFKSAGRVGDSGVIGAGTYADNRTCAVSATGDGELFIRSAAAYSVSARMMFCQQSLADASQAAIDDIRSLGGVGGLIAIDNAGNVAMPYHAEGMFRGTVDAAGKFTVALYEE